MTRDELAQIIFKSIEELGFARIAKPAVLDVFSSGEPASFDIHQKLRDFAAAHGFTCQTENADEDFLVFRPANDKS